jgi:hypothetical protein
MSHPMREPVADLVRQATGLMDDFLRDRVNLEEYSARLKALEVEPLMETYQEDFKKDAGLVYYLDALMLLSSLQHELEFQVAEYGANVATEDLKNLQELLEKFPKD